MAVVYIKEQGACIKKHSNRLIIEKDGELLAELRLIRVTGISVIGNVQITTQALHTILQAGVDVSFFSGSGRYLSHMAPEHSKNIFLRLSQYHCYESMPDRLKFARAIVDNKISNQMEMIRQYRWNDSDYNYREDLKSLSEYQKTLERKETVNGLMGVEGICSAIYFRSYAKMFKSSVSFQERNRRPPKDPINAILSLTYTFLTKEITAALEAESFELYLGFLHGIRYGRKSLALDLIEEFRQPVADRFVLRLFNKGMLGEDDFQMEDGAVRLKPNAFKQFCMAYEKWMQEPVYKNESQNFRDIIRQQADVLKQTVRENKIYRPFCWREKDVQEECI